MKLTLQLTFVILVTTLSLFFYREMEPVVHPVVSAFTLKSVVQQGNTITISGTMNKKRSCEFKRAVVYGYMDNEPGTILGFSFKDQVPKGDNLYTGSRATGIQSWGPWDIYLPPEFKPDFISLYSIHNCWPFWVTETKLADIPLITSE